MRWWNSGNLNKFAFFRVLEHRQQIKVCWSSLIIRKYLVEWHVKLDVLSLYLLSTRQLSKHRFEHTLLCDVPFELRTHWHNKRKRKPKRRLALYATEWVTRQTLAKTSRLYLLWIALAIACSTENFLHYSTAQTLQHKNSEHQETQRFPCHCLRSLSRRFHASRNHFNHHNMCEQQKWIVELKLRNLIFFLPTKKFSSLIRMARRSCMFLVIQFRYDAMTTFSRWRFNFKMRVVAIKWKCWPTLGVCFSSVYLKGPNIVKW